MADHVGDSVGILFDYFGSAYATPKKARGKCLEVTEEALGLCSDDWVMVGAASDREDLFERLKTLNQYSDHFALLRDDVVIDFTFRQFDSETPYPLVCSLTEWIERLARAWECDSLEVSEGWHNVEDAHAAGETRQYYFN